MLDQKFAMLRSKCFSMGLFTPTASPGAFEMSRIHLDFDVSVGTDAEPLLQLKPIFSKGSSLCEVAFI